LCLLLPSSFFFFSFSSPVVTAGSGERECDEQRCGPFFFFIFFPRRFLPLPLSFFFLFLLSFGGALPRKGSDVGGERFLSSSLLFFFSLFLFSPFFFFLSPPGNLDCPRARPKRTGAGAYFFLFPPLFLRVLTPPLFFLLFLTTSGYMTNEWNRPRWLPLFFPFFFSFP